MAPRPRVVFAYMPAHSGAGSKAMRVDQLSAIANEVIGERWEVDTLRLPRRDRVRRHRQTAESCEGAVVIFLKGAFSAHSPDTQRAWASRARAICVDYVDATINQAFEAPITLHIAASRAGMRGLRGKLDDEACVRLLDHHWDPRLGSVPRLVPPFKCGYFGHLRNTYIPAGDAHRVQQVQIAGSEVTSDFASSLSSIPLHYAVRSTARLKARMMFKPFTKGFNAAAVGANVIVDRDTDDAAELLGEDYPFLLEQPSDAAISKGLDIAEGIYGTSAWDEALDRMSALRSIGDPWRVAESMDALLAEAMDLTATQ